MATTEPTTVDGAKLTEGRRVLVIEDTELVRRGICMVLADAGYDPVGVDTGERGLAEFRNLGARVVIVDLTLPGLSGVATIQQLRQWDPRIPIIVATGHARGPELEAARAIAWVRVLNKPFQAEELITSVEMALSPSVPPEPARG